MSDNLLTIIPLVMAGLVLLYLAWVGRPATALMVSLLVLFGLWLLVQTRRPGFVSCSIDPCSPYGDPYGLLMVRLVALQYVTPVFLAALLSRPILLRGRPGLAMVAGVAALGILWAVRVAPGFLCQGVTTECEWAWVGIVFFSAIAIAQSVLVVLINLFMYTGDHRRSAAAGELSQLASDRG